MVTTKIILFLLFYGLIREYIVTDDIFQPDMFLFLAGISAIASHELTEFLTNKLGD